MNTFHTIIWYYGVALFTVSVVLFWGLLGYSLFKGIKEQFKK